MSENPYIEKINQLLQGKITELVVDQTAFSMFREAWNGLSNKEEIVGEAGLNGQIVYRYLKKKD